MTQSESAGEVAPPQKQSSLPLVCCTMSLVLMLISVILSLLVLVQIIPIQWDSVVVPGFTVFVLVPGSLFALVLSGASLIRHRDKRSLLAVIVGLAAFAASLCDAFIVVGTAIAANPV